MPHQPDFPPQTPFTWIVTLQIAAACSIWHSVGFAAELETRQIPARNQGTQPIRCYFPKPADQPVPLLVVLHSWSAGYEQTGFVEDCQTECEQRGWSLIHPHFQGPNLRPEACASEQAIQDILDAIKYAQTQSRIDPRRIYLVGTSGGGHMSLIMAGRHPELWAGVSAWVPISDLKAWHAESVARKQKYAVQMEQVCGGKPGDSAAVDTEYRNRSPLTWLDRAKGVSIDLNAGIDDGHTGSVPVSQSLLAFNLLARVNGQPDRALKTELIEAITTSRQIPAELANEKTDEAGRQHKILFRRSAGPTRVTIFQGGHEGDMKTAVKWLADQSRK